MFYIYALTETFGVVANKDVTLPQMYNYYMIINTLDANEVSEFLTLDESMCLESKLKNMPRRIGCNCY
jgi:hypothetical protein